MKNARRLKKKHAKQKRMTTLDTIVASAEDSLLPGINYSLNNKRGASFVHQRVLSTCFPVASGVYSPTSQ